MAGVFTQEMRRTHTIYLPNMLPYQNRLLSAAFRFAGWRLKSVPEAAAYPKETFAVMSGDYCSPGIHIVGNMLALVEKIEREEREEKAIQAQQTRKSQRGGRDFAERDPLNIAFLEPQSGGACKAGNLYHAMCRALERTGRGDIPVISLNPHGLLQHPGFSLTPKLLAFSAAAILYSDLLMTLLLQVRPYERERGSAERVYEREIRRLEEQLLKSSCRGNLLHQKNPLVGPYGLLRRNPSGGAHFLLRRKENYRHILRAFAEIPRDNRTLKKVAVTGEIYSKFAPAGNQGLERFLQEQGTEYRLGGFANYCIYLVYTERKMEALKGKRGAGRKKQAELLLLQRLLEKLQREMNREIRRAGFSCDAEFRDMERYAARVISDEYNIGDGWLCAAEASDAAEKGYNRVLFCHPFTCLVSHVGSRGVLKKLKQQYPDCRFTSIEYDYSGSKAMRDSRILMGIS